ncbi:MAG: PAS domain S-box protein [Pyrinomonadaceae bacterium]
MDTSNSNKAEVPTTESSKISRVIAETASDAIITIDEHSTMLFANAATERIFGYAQAELIGQSLTMLMPEHLRQLHRFGLARYLATGHRHIDWQAVPLTGIRKDGSEVPLEVSFGEFTEDGRRFFAGIARDVTEGKQAQESLKRNEERFRSLIENATDIITVLNRDGTRRYVSPSVQRSLGYEPQELIGKNPFDLVHPDDAPELQKLFAAGLTHPGYIVSKEFRIKHKDGSWKTHEATAHNLLDDPALGGIVINSRDITARNRMERRLTVQYEAARILAAAESLCNAAPELMQAMCESLGWDLGQLWIADRETNKLRWLASWQVDSPGANDLAAASRGLVFSRGIGLPGRIWAHGMSQWIHDIAEDFNFPRRETALQADLHSAFGFPINLGDEVSGVMEFFSHELQSSDQSLLDVMTGIGNQIGQFLERERVEAERSKLYEREQRARLELEATMERMRQVQKVTEVALAHLSLDKLLAELLDRVRDAVDVDTVVIMLLEESNELVAWATKGLELDVTIHVPVGAGFAGRVAERKAPIAIDNIEEADLHTPFLREHGVKSLLGVPLLLEGRVLGIIHVGRLALRPFTDADTRLLELVAFRVALAIDNARLFEEERAARRDAEAASRAKDEFLTTISHELRTPLTPIIGWIHMIRNDLLPPEEAAHGLQIIDKNSHALKRLINDLLDMSAILSGKMRMEQKPLLLEEVVREAVEVVRTESATREVRLEITASNSHDPVVTGDRSRLVQAFSNVLDNAIKFSRPGGRVKIICQDQEDKAIVRVEDEGEGISSEFLPFVFERFRQEDGSKTRAHGGLGLGLALVKSFVEAHDGAVEAASAGQGRGSRFTITLPRSESAAAVSSQTATDTGARALPAHLMIVEDDADTLEMLRTTLEAKGFKVTTCESGAEALSIAPHKSVDLIVSDIGMPEMDGLEMIRKLREIDEYKAIPAIALTGYASNQDAKSAVAAGFSTHISKPVDPAELLKMINQLIQKGLSNRE